MDAGTRRTFAEYGTQALWNMRSIEDPTPADALAITKALRTHGGMEGRRLAERIEMVCRLHARWPAHQGFESLE